MSITSNTSVARMVARLSRLHLWAFFVAALIFTAAFVQQRGPLRGSQHDFLVYYTGARVALHGENPYDIDLIQRLFSEQTGDPPFDCGFFLPPISFWLLAPWAATAWPFARISWCVVSAVAAVTPARLIFPPERSSASGDAWGWIGALVLLNPLVWRSMSLGQTPFFIVGCVVGACWAHQRKLEWFSILLWSFTSLKPHIGIPLCLFAAYYQGIRSAVAIFLAAVVGNLAGAALLGPPTTVVAKYVSYLSTSHNAVGFNHPSYDQITSWNRLVAMFGGPEWPIGAVGSVVGCGTAAAFIYLFQFRRQPAPSDAWVLAAVAAFAPLVSQLHGYELVVWTLMIPYLREIASLRRRLDLTYLLGMLSLASVPLAVVGGLAEGSAYAPIIRSYRAITVLLVAMYFLFRRPTASPAVA